MVVHELIESKAQATPHAVAIAAGEERVTYRQLNDWASELTHRLWALGVGSGVPVGLCVQRSAALVIGALGILKAGAAYLPLDPKDPAVRLSMALEDSKCQLVVTRKSDAERLPAGNWRILVLDDNESSFPGEPEVADPSSITPDDLAYVIFTSGSTGRPKGVQIAHANLLNLINWHNRAFNVTASDRATMQASPGFDASVWEVWPYLAAGASVHIVDDSIRTHPEALRKWMIDSGITISFLPTALAESMIELPWPAETSLRYLLTGADVLRRCPPAGLPFALVNNYGPTECTVVATSGVVPVGAAFPTIGRPIDNAEAYVVDEQLHLVPAGTPGELLIGGAGVGRGYLNAPELTDDKFVPDPFTTAAGSRLYRTGDLARLLPDGQIEFLGRIDQQIKIRGYRIEPGEITAVLERHPAIQSSVVTAQANDSAETSLVAYVVMKPGAGANAEALRSFLLTQLPDYMVPATFVKLRELPVTAHGKIDRFALPTPDRENLLSDDFFEAPQTKIEQWLALFLTKLLGLPRIGRDDNFFRLGGHSLMGAQLLAKIQQTFDVELSLRSLFDHPTVRGIAAEIEGLIHAKVDAMSDDEARGVLESWPGGIAV